MMIRSRPLRSSRTRVATVLAKLEPGGAQLMVLRLVAELERHRFESLILAGEASSEGIDLYSEAGFPVEVHGDARGAQYACDEGFVRWLRSRLAGADIVHAHMFGAWWAASRAAAGHVPLLASEHNAIRWPGEPREDEMRSALSRVDGFIAHGPAPRSLALRLGLPPSRLIEGSSSIADESVRALPWLRSPRVIFAGRLHHEKGPDVLLRALPLLDPPPATYLLGTGPMEGWLRTLAAELGLGRSVRFCGWRRRVGRWLRGASVCAVPSRHEAWSQTAVTAMSLGVPVVGAAVEGVPETLGRNRGILVPPDDPEALAAAIGDVLAGRHRTDLDGAAAYARSFTADAVAAGYARLYRELLERPREVAVGRPQADERALAA
jgi:glycosyltransferase involved in cell wall biosynthesis